MKIPWSKRKKALIVVDVQAAFLNARNRYILASIKKLLKRASYNFYAESVFYAEKGSQWDKQTNWTLPKDANAKTSKKILDLLKQKNYLHIEKTTKSAFKGNINLHNQLKKKAIREVHIVGLDANDCVLATAYEAFDLGYFTYVIEECTDSSSSKKIKQAGFEVLRQVNLTNNSCLEKIGFVKI